MRLQDEKSFIFRMKTRLNIQSIKFSFVLICVILISASLKVNIKFMAWVLRVWFGDRKKFASMILSPKMTLVKLFFFQTKNQYFWSEIACDFCLSRRARGFFFLLKGKAKWSFVCTFGDVCVGVRGEIALKFENSHLKYCCNLFAADAF